MTVDASQHPPQLLGGTAIRPPERKGTEKIKLFFHNPADKTWCTRTCKSWFQITLFYLVYYSCLAGFWYGMLNIFFLTLPDGRPKWEGEESLIGVNPGVGVRPLQHLSDIDSSIFVLREGIADSEFSLSSAEDSGNIGYAARYKDFLKKYEKVANHPNAIDCEGDEPNAAPEGKFCRFSVSQLGECGRFPYGFGAAGDPCVLLKLNKIFNWVPEHVSSEEDLPEGSPQDLVNALRQKGYPKQVTFHCEGQYPADQEVLMDNIEYFPSSQGVSLKYFPYDNLANEVWPLVAIRFKNLPKGQLVHVMCKAYFKGVQHSKKEKMGLVLFEMMRK